MIYIYRLPGMAVCDVYISSDSIRKFIYKKVSFGTSKSAHAMSSWLAIVYCNYGDHIVYHTISMQCSRTFLKVDYF